MEDQKTTSSLIANIFNPNVEIIWLFGIPYWCYFSSIIDPDWHGKEVTIQHMKIPGYMRGYECTWIVGDRSYAKRRTQQWEHEGRKFKSGI